MNTAKYRFWDIYKDRYEYIGEGFGVYALFRGSVYEIGGYGELAMYHIDYAEVEQYIGMKDLNGAEIYVNDTVKDRNGRLFKVQYNDFCAFMLYPLDDPAEFMAIYPNIELEVVFKKGIEFAHTLDEKMQEDVLYVQFDFEDKGTRSEDNMVLQVSPNKDNKELEKIIEQYTNYTNVNLLVTIPLVKGNRG